MGRLIQGSLVMVMGTVIGIALAGVAGAQGKPDVNGTWDFTIESPQRTSSPVVTLKVDGEKLTGTMKGTRGELPVTGTIKGSEIKLDYTINFQGNEMKISMSGTVDKDTMKGTADFGGLATGPWSAKRHEEKAVPASGAATPATPASSATASSASSAAVTPASSGANISGAWIFAVETEQGSGSPSFTFKQEGDKLTGTYKGLFGEAPLEGTMKGKDVNFSIKVNAQGVEGVVVYSGMIEGNSMKGTVKLGDLGSGTWTAKRQ